MWLTADADELWSDLALRVGRTGGHLPPAGEVMLEAVADVLTEQQVALLLAVGYRHPPPPPAHVLVEQTRASVQEALVYGRITHIDAVRGALLQFVEDFAKHVPQAEHRRHVRVLKNGRRVGIAAALLAVLGNSEVKTGDEFAFDVSMSVKDRVKVELTVPAPWHHDEEADASLIHSAMRDFERTVAEVNASGRYLTLALPARGKPV